jgi:hypothetical protein
MTTTGIRELTANELDAVSGGQNEKIGQQVVESMWNTIDVVNTIIASATPAPTAPGANGGRCMTNHNGVMY